MIKYIFELLGLVLLVGIAMVMGQTFFTAYTNPSKQVIVDINSIGEANIEAVLIALAIVWGLILIARVLWRLKKSYVGTK